MTDSNELAEDRTDLAEDRTIMAMERTFAGWMRTAFAAIGIGLGLRAVFGEFDPPWLARALATAAILMGSAIAYTAVGRACKTFDRLSAHYADTPKINNMRATGYSISAGGIVLAIALWIFHDPSSL